MLCQRCNEKAATVHLTKIINSEKTELHLCELCAKDAGSELGFIFESNFSFQNLIAGLLGGELSAPQEPSVEVKCSQCGLTFSDFKNAGILGCGECYSRFQAGLEPLLNKIHGSVRHVGKVPQRTGGKILIRKEIDSLRRELQQAITLENYEKAAELRDEIREREQEL